MKLLRESVLFALVGAIGFVVDTAALYALRGTFGPFGARIFSFLAAVFVTWLLNRRLTFAKRRSGLAPRREFAAYLLLMLGGGAVNYGVYAWLVLASATVAAHPVLGVAAGSVAGMGVNLANARWLVFRGK